ncbi:MAG: hypothetical protein AAGB27_11945, partial [Pseudomonadota bacterium]
MSIEKLQLGQNHLHSERLNAAEPSTPLQLVLVRQEASLHGAAAIDDSRSPGLRLERLPPPSRITRCL